MRLGISLSTLYNSYFLSKWIVSITIRWAAMRLPNRIVSLLLPQDRLAPVASKYFLYNNGYRLCFCINITTSKRWGK